MPEPQPTAADALDALRVCFFALPGQPAQEIVALGLVLDVTVEPDPDAPGAGVPGVPPRCTVSCTLLRPPAEEDEDAAAALLGALVENRLAGMPQWSRVSVQVAEEPQWTPARIDPATRRTLGLDPPLFPILGNRTLPR